MTVILGSVLFTDEYPIFERPHLSSFLDSGKLLVDTVGEMICNIPVDVPFACEVFPIVQLIIFRGEGINER